MTVFLTGEAITTNDVEVVEPSLISPEDIEDNLDRVVKSLPVTPEGAAEAERLVGIGRICGSLLGLRGFLPGERSVMSYDAQNSPRNMVVSFTTAVVGADGSARDVIYHNVMIDGQYRPFPESVISALGKRAKVNELAGKTALRYLMVEVA